MPAANYKLYIDQGSTLSRTVSLKKWDGTPIDITGATIVSEIRQTATSPTIIQALTVTLSGTPTDGTFTLSLTAGQTLALPVDANTGPENVSTLYAYDVVMTKSGVVTRLFQGEAIVSPEVSR